MQQNLQLHVPLVTAAISRMCAVAFGAKFSLLSSQAPAPTKRLKMPVYKCMCL